MIGSAKAYHDTPLLLMRLQPGTTVKQSCTTAVGAAKELMQAHSHKV